MIILINSVTELINYLFDCFGFHGLFVGYVFHLIFAELLESVQL